MNSLKSLFGQVRRLKEQVPPKPQPVHFDYSLLTLEEQEQFVLFVESLPRPLEWDVLNDEQACTLRYWFKLEKALRDGNSAEAEQMRRRLSVTLDQLVDRFLSLDISSIPEGKVIVDGGACYSHRSHHDIKTNYIDIGKAQKRIEDIWRWVEHFESAILV